MNAALLFALVALWQSDARQELRNRGLDPQWVTDPVHISELIRETAKAAVGDVVNPAIRAERIFDRIRALRDDGRIAADPDNTPKRREPKTAEALLRAALDPTSPAPKAGCYELSALYVAMARSVGLRAVGVERAKVSGVGQIGHIMAGVALSREDHVWVVDLQNLRKAVSEPIRRLNDFEFAAHHYNHQAVAHILNVRLPEGRRAIRIATALAPDQASFVSNRSVVMARQGYLASAAADAAHAVTLDPRVALFHYQLGHVSLQLGDFDQAEASLTEALQRQKDYGLAMRDLGLVLTWRGEIDRAHDFLKRASRRPNTPDAQNYLRAFRVARKGVRNGKGIDAARSALERSFYTAFKAASQ